jgi:hypothetical protein
LVKAPLKIIAALENSKFLSQTKRPAQQNSNNDGTSIRKLFYLMVHRQSQKITLKATDTILKVSFRTNHM